jgi:tetratricopeptide (TPR) repeat protein
MPRPDRYGLPISTDAAAGDAYAAAVELLLCAQPGAQAALGRALEHDPGFALAHAALARAHQSLGQGARAREAIARAVACAAQATDRERSHVHALERVVLGDAAAALEAIRAHLVHWPRDVMVLAPCAGVFGLFGFSGRAGREHELDAFLDPHAAALGDDPWYLASRAFARCEVGQLALARADIERSLASWPHNANGAHIRAHVDYECGDDAAGLAWLRDWCAGYAREGSMHCHLHWHVALSALELGDTATAWRVFDTQVRPGAAWGPPLNLITDAASFLIRAEWAGLPRSLAHWQAVADCVRRDYPQPGVGFLDVHAALAFAMTGADDDLARIRDGARGPMADLVSALARAFDAFVHGDDVTTLDHLLPLMPTHERLGGSRAQRDLLEYLVIVAQQRAGRPPGWVRSRDRPLPVVLSAGPARA